MITLNDTRLHSHWLRGLWKTDHDIASLDPLSADTALQQLPQLNTTKNVPGLVALLECLVQSAHQTNHYSVEEACAVMRDFGMVLGSLKRFGLEPEEVNPALRQLLPNLGAITQLPPRDTLLHYTIWNPTGSRMRSYTGTTDEQSLIESVQMSMPPLESALQHLAQLHETDPADTRYAALGEAVCGHLEGLIAGVVHARRHVSTSYFAEELRLYFDAILLNGTSYLGPGAVEMPLFVLDHLLWSSDTTDQEYIAFKKAYLPYIRPEWQQLYGRYEGTPSLIAKLCDHLGQFTRSPAAQQRSVKAVLSMGTRLKSFRMPHRKLAEEAYVHGEEGQRQHGSGGYAPSILSHIIRLMLNRFEHLENSLERSKKESIVF